MAQEQALKDITEKFGGKWKESKSENIEEFLKEMGVNVFFRSFAAFAHPDFELVVEGTEVKMTFRILFKSDTVVYKYGEEVEQETSHGKFKGTLSYENGVLTSKQTPAEGNTECKPVDTTREISEAGELTMTLKAGEVTAKRFFTKCT